MSLGQSVRKFVKHTILRRPRPTAPAAKAPYINPFAKIVGGRHRRGTTLPYDEWKRRKRRRIMVRESRRRNRV